MKKPSLINPSDEEPVPQDDSANEGEDIQSPILQAAEAKIEEGLVPENRANYHKIVVSGMALALQNGQNGILYSLKNSKDPVYSCAKGAVNLVLLLRRQSKGVMPLKAMVPAGMTLMIKGLDFVDKSKIMPIDNEALVSATHVFTNELMKAFNITTKMLAHAATKVHALTQNPVTMDKMRKASGIIPVAPNAPPMPPQQPSVHSSLLNSGAT